MNALYLLDQGDEPIPYRLTDAGELATPAAPLSGVDMLDGPTWDRLLELDTLCECGSARGEHDADAPHGRDESRCEGFREGACAPESGAP